jgi:hypothetical protein
VQSSRSELIFPGNILLPSSVSKSKRNRKTSKTTQKADHGLFFYPEDIDKTFLRNIDGIIPDYTALHFR